MVTLSRTVGTLFASVALAVLLSPSPRCEEQTLSTLENGLSELIYELSQSVVTVEASRWVTADVAAGPGGEALQRIVSTGIVCDSLGHVLVVANAVADQDRIRIRFEDRVVPAELIGIDHLYELALLKAAQTFGRPAFVSERHACAGQIVLALGNVLGLRASPTLGFCAGARSDGTLQFSLPVAAGSIGSGIFDLSGQMLGIVTGTPAEEQATAMCVPGYRLPEIVRYLRENGSRPAGYIGVSAADIAIVPPLRLTRSVTFASAGDGNGSELLEQGVLITRVVTGSPADVAGMLKGDLLLAMNGRQVVTAADLAGTVGRMLPGSDIEVVLLRKNRPITLHIAAGNRPLPPLDRRYMETVGDTERITPDSLARAIEHLKSEVARLESQLQSLQ